MEVSALAKVQPGVKILARFRNRARIFSPAKRAEKYAKSPRNRKGLKKEREHPHQLCFRISVNFLRKFAFCARAEIHHVITTVFSPEGGTKF